MTRIPYTQQEQAAAIIPGIPGARVWADDPAVATAFGTLEPPQRLRLMRFTFEKFFPWVWLAILFLLASG